MNYDCLNLCQKSDLHNNPPLTPPLKKDGDFHCAIKNRTQLLECDLNPPNPPFTKEGYSLFLKEG